MLSWVSTTMIAAEPTTSDTTTNTNTNSTTMANTISSNRTTSTSNENIDSNTTTTKNNNKSMMDTAGSTTTSTNKTTTATPSTPTPTPTTATTTTTIPESDFSETENSSSNSSNNAPPPPLFAVAIAGGGIVGLTLALSLQRHCRITAHVYEQADGFFDDVGAGMGLYANGLRVLHELGLAAPLEPVTVPFRCRKWERHDGTTVAEAPEAALLRPPAPPENGECGGTTAFWNGGGVGEKETQQQQEDESDGDGDDGDAAASALLQSAGCRRWRLQKVLFDAARERGIPVHFGKRTVRIETGSSDENGSDESDDQKAVLHFQDGTSAAADLVLACDGCQSAIRQQLTRGQHELRYTGTTCLMGIARWPCDGIRLPSSDGGDTHGVFFPTGADEQCFQFHFSVPRQRADPANWGTLSQAVTERECAALVERLRSEGWSEERYLKPFEHVVSALRIGFCLLEPPLDNFVHGGGRVVLLGDAAHPPVPYLGQGGAMGLEDAGVLSLLLRHYCCGDGTSAHFDAEQLPAALRLYDRLRVPRTRAMLARAKQMGRAQAVRASPSPLASRRRARETMLQRQVFFHETLPILWPGANYDCHAAVARAIAEAGLPAVPEGSEPAEGDGGSVVSSKSSSRKNEHDLAEKGKGRVYDGKSQSGAVINGGAEKEDR